MRKHWLAMVAIGLSVCACDEAVNVDCGEGGCQFSDDQFSDGECQDGDIRCTSDKKGYLKCRENRWSDFEFCQDDKLCDEKQGKCVDGCEDNVIECTGVTDQSYRKCINRQWVDESCENGKICQNGNCVPTKTDECQTGVKRCVVDDEKKFEECQDNHWIPDYCVDNFICKDGECVTRTTNKCNEGTKRCITNTKNQYELCQSNQWTLQTCMNDFVCENNECVPPKTDECNNKPPECTGETPKAYRECVDNIWVPKTCGGEQVCENGKCVTTVPSDCKEGEFLGCTADNNQKIVQTCNPKGENQVSCDEGKICDSEKKDCIAPPKPEDPCHYNKIQEELKTAMAGCEEAKTAIVSKSTELSELDNWYAGDKQCLVFCGDVPLDNLKNSIPLPDNAKIVGVKEAKLRASELSKPLFKGKDGESITSNTFKNLDIAVEKMLISNNGAHAVLANNAKDVTVENVSLTGKLEHNDNTTIQEVGCLFGKTKGKSTIQNTTLNDATIVLNSIPNYDESGNYNRCVGGFVGESSDVLTITTPKINGLTINANYARHVGGLVGNSGSKTKISGSYHFDQSKINYDISSYDVSNLTISNVIHYAGGLVGKAENASLTIENMAIQINTIQAYVYCAAGIIGHVRGSESELTIQNSYLKVSEQIKSGSYAGGVAAYLIDLRKMNMENLIVKIKNIDTIKQSEFKYDDQNDRNGLDENKAGGLIGTIESLNSEGIMNHIYLIADHIKANKYAGGYIGRIKEGKGNNIKLLNNSNVIKEVLANENSGGLIGFVEKNNTINIEKLQNIVLTLKTTKASTYPGGVVGRISSDASIDNIKLKTVISYSQRFQNNVRRHEGALISSTQCKNENGPFTKTLYIDDIKVDYTYSAIACINAIQDIEDNKLHRIWTEDECKNSKADGFTCTKVKVKDSKAPITIPLFDTSMLDEDGNIQW